MDCKDYYSSLTDSKEDRFTLWKYFITLCSQGLQDPDNPSLFILPGNTHFESSTNPSGQSQSFRSRHIVPESPKSGRGSHGQSRSTVLQHTISGSLKHLRGSQPPDVSRGSRHSPGQSRSTMSQHNISEPPKSPRRRPRTRNYPFRGRAWYQPIAPHLRARNSMKSPTLPISEPATTTSDPGQDSQAACLCDENPASFWGTTDTVRAWEEMEQSPALHCLPALACQNTRAHPDPNTPHRVCRACHERADAHIRLTNPGLLVLKYVPVCRLCRDDARARCTDCYGPVEDCVCFTNVHGQNWLCFTCREAHLMRALACWEAENEMLPNDFRQRLRPLCRCGEDLIDYQQQQQQQQGQGQRQGQGPEMRYFLCIGCGALKEVEIEK